MAIIVKGKITTLLLLLVAPVLSMGIWTTMFIPKIFKQNIESFSNAKTSLSMVATFASKHTNLDKVKERYLGREDFDTPGSDTSEDDAISSSTFFYEADEEEVDPPSRGQTVTGTVIEIDENGALLEIGGKMSGYIPIKEASLIPVKDLVGIFEVGQKVTAEVIGTLKGMPVMSLRSAELVNAWEKILNTRAADAEFPVTVLEVNRGGAVCSCFGLKAFLPGSHVIGNTDASLIGSTLMVSG